MMTTSDYVCDRCREPLCFTCFDKHVIIRPCRFGKCRHYKGAGTSGHTCRGIGENREVAVMAFEHLTTVVPKSLIGQTD